MCCSRNRLERLLPLVTSAVYSLINVLRINGC